jgi:hypothetical protein
MGQGCEGEIHLSLCDEPDEVLRAVVQQVHLHTWVALLELPNGLDHVDASGNGHGRDPDRAPEHACDLGNRVARDRCRRSPLVLAPEARGRRR